jgi:hypothetical protein
MGDAIYHKFVKRWEEVTDLPTQSVGPFTRQYKKIVQKLKVMPWPALVLASVIFVVVLYLAIGSTITFFVSVLQRGF